MNNPLSPFIEKQGYLIVDGGLATELEARGHDLNDPLWSARVLLTNEAAIAAVHADYLHAGADCIISATYQATIAGFMARSLTEEAAVRLIQRSVALAVEARDGFWAVAGNRTGRLRPLVAASVGPYGAYLADGSEYNGNYGLSTENLISFHRRRFGLLCGSDADLLACETIPSLLEANALLTLLNAHPTKAAWFSFSCRDGRHISDGTPIATVAERLSQNPQVIAIGINCTPPRHIPTLIESIRSVSEMPIVVYPNSGESYEVATKTWHGERDPDHYGDAATGWYQRGAQLIGGCCRTGPLHIQRLRQNLREESATD